MNLFTTLSVVFLLKPNVTIFEYIKDIFVEKQGNLTLEEYNCFLINRWVSFINPTTCLLVNNMFNKKTLIEDKQLHYQIMLAGMPKLKYSPRIQYIKKTKTDNNSKDTDDNKLNQISSAMELSKREITLLLTQQEMLSQ